MANLLEQLENNEAVLLMYLADELPMEDRAEVEQLLSGDAALRQELEQLRDLQASAMETLQRCDEYAGTPGSREAAVAKVSRLLRQWQADQCKNRPVEIPHARRTTRWWVYPAAAAAAVIVVLLWPGRTVPTPSSDRLADSALIFENDPVQDGHLADAERQLTSLAAASREIPTMFPMD